jgi:hypothetical protein
MTDTESDHQPNEYGFAGGATAPEPEIKPIEKVDGESIAVPAGDITGAITEAIDELVERDDDKDDDH